MKRTPWFDAMKDKPARVGLYEFRFHGWPSSAVGRLKWDERNWSGSTNWPFLVLPGDKWRGLAEKP
jgi:hypothetical protein